MPPVKRKVLAKGRSPSGSQKKGKKAIDSDAGGAGEDFFIDDEKKAQQDGDEGAEEAPETVEEKRLRLGERQ